MDVSGDQSAITLQLFVINYCVVSPTNLSVVVKALRYYSDGTWIDSRWCHREFFSVVPLTEPCALRSTEPLKVNTRDFCWNKGGRCVWLTTYHPCSAETSIKSGALIYPEPLRPPRPVAGDLYFFLLPYKTKLKVSLLTPDGV